MTIKSLRNLIDTQKQTAAQQLCADEEFIADYKLLTQCERMIENNVFMLKHKTIPDAIKAGKLEIDFNPIVQSYIAPWVANDLRLKTLTLDYLLQTFTKIFAGYSVTRVGAEVFKISWAINK